jgi:hypothetical protein
VPQLFEVGSGASWLLVTDTGGVALSDSVEATRGRGAGPLWMGSWVGFTTLEAALSSDILGAMGSYAE